MDSITQATLGAALGQAILGNKIGGKAAVIGAVIATIPDLDVVLLPLFDHLQRISIHRGFSHSIVFSLLGAFLIAFFLSKIKWTSQFTLKRLILFTWLVLFTHILLDAFTTYGTQLFLPFSDYRVSFDSINIVDPFYTAPLLLGVITTIYIQQKKSTRNAANNFGIILSSLYLLFTLGHKKLVTTSIKSQLASQNIPYSSIKTIPVGVGNVNWYGVAKSEETLYIGQYSSRKQNSIDFHSFPINNDLLDKVNQQLASKLKWFSQNYYTVAEFNGHVRLYNLQCDMQGIRTYGEYKAPTAFYFEITTHSDGSYNLTTGMHPKNK